MKQIELEVGRERFVALEVGAVGAPAVLCLHGFPDHPPSFAAFASALAAEGFRVIVPWLRGYAPSPLDGPFHLDQLAADARAMIGALGADAIHLVGHDWGSAITHAVLADPRDASIARAVAISVPHPVAFARNLIRFPEQWRRSSYMARFQRRAADRWVAADDFAAVRALWRRWSPSYELPAEAWRSLRETLAASHPAPLEYYRSMRQPTGASQRALLTSRIPTPTLTIFGAEDGCIDARLATGSARFFRASFTLEVIDRAGHFIHLERPERLAASVAAHLRLHRP